MGVGGWELGRSGATAVSPRVVDQEEEEEEEEERREGLRGKRARGPKGGRDEESARKHRCSGHSWS